MLFRAITTLIAAGGLALAVGSTAACGGGGEGYKLPVTSPLVPYKKPTRAELVPDEAKSNTPPKPKGPMPDMGDDDDTGSAKPTKPTPPAGSNKNAATKPKKSGKKK